MKDFRLRREAEARAREDDKGAIPVCATTILRQWQVTTCYRESSAMDGHSWFYETFVWKIDPSVEGGRYLVGDATSMGHVRAVLHILDNSEWVDIEDEDE